MILETTAICEKQAGDSDRNNWSFIQQLQPAAKLNNSFENCNIIVSKKSYCNQAISMSKSKLHF